MVSLDFRLSRGEGSDSSVSVFGWGFLTWLTVCDGKRGGGIVSVSLMQ